MSPARIDRVLIVGLGSIGARHARIARELLPSAEIMALRHRRCDDHHHEGVDRCVTSMPEALEFGATVAVIANPATYHLAAAVPLAEAGTHLLVEKPLSSSTAGVAELLDTSRRRGTVLMMGYNLRFMSSLREFRRLIQERAVGQVLSIRAEAGQYLPTWRPSADYRSSVSALTELGGGALLELSHEIDYLRWCFGEVSWVSGTLSRVSSLEIDVEDVAHLTLGFEAIGASTAPIASLTLDFIRRDATRTCVAIGERGTLRWDAASGSVEQHNGDATGWRTIFAQPHERDDTYRAEWLHFLNCVQRSEPVGVPADDGLEVLRIIEAARRSSETRCVVSIVAGDDQPVLRSGRAE